MNTPAYVSACRNAIEIYSGACNARGIARALVKCFDSLAGDNDPVHHAPSRLILAQLGHLTGCGFGNYADESRFNPADDEKYCEAISDVATLTPIEIQAELA